MGVIDLDFQSPFGRLDSEFYEILLVRPKICHELEVELSHLHQICLGFSRLVLEMRVIDLDLSGHLAISTQNSKNHHSTSLWYTDLGRPKGVTCPNVVLLVRSSASVQIHPLYHALIRTSFSIRKSRLLDYARWYHKRPVHRQRINVDFASCSWPNNSAHGKITLNEIIYRECCKSSLQTTTFKINPHPSTLVRVSQS